MATSARNRIPFGRVRSEVAAFQNAMDGWDSYPEVVKFLRIEKNRETKHASNIKSRAVALSPRAGDEIDMKPVLKFKVAVA